MRGVLLAVSGATLLAFLAMVPLAIAGGGAASAAPAAVVVLAHDFMFAPTSVTVAAGSTVTWTNHDGEPHTVVSIDGLFRSGALDSNESFSFRFDKPGTYRYVCTIHPQMQGSVIVQ